MQGLARCCRIWKCIEILKNDDTNEMKHKKLFFLTIVLAIAASSLQAQNIAKVKSPSGNIVATVFSENGNLKMNISKNKTPLLSSSLGLEINGENIGSRVVLDGKISSKTINEKYAIYGNHPQAHNYCNEINLPLVNGKIKYTLALRAYNDGVALRYIIAAKDDINISKELTAFTIDDQAMCLWAEYEPSYENLTQQTTFAQIDEGKTLIAPITLQYKNQYISLSEAANLSFTDMVWMKNGNSLRAVYPASPQGFTAKPENGTITTPWRSVMIADDLTQLVNSDLIKNLNDAPKTGMDFSWVKPGRALWQWWSIGEPQLNDQKDWYDAAKELNWEYYLIDDGWRVWRDGQKDQWQCLKEVIDYGKSIGIKTIIWLDSKEMRNQASMRAYLEKVKQAGASGIKIDFFPPATPEIMELYKTALQETYRLKLLCNFHGCTKPTGVNRTWPHELTREAVRGNEYHMTRYNRLLSQNEYTMTVFTRFLAGPADMTPVIFSEKELRHFTWAHQLAQPIILLSPIAHFADSYKEYVSNPAKDILQQMPTTWDETIVLPLSQPGKIVGFAKRKGNTWWIGILNGKENISVAMDFKFLKKRAKALLIEDVAEKLNAVNRVEKNISPSEKINLKLQAGGGQVMRLEMK